MPSFRRQIRAVLGSAVFLVLSAPGPSLADSADPCADRAKLNAEFAEVQLLIVQDQAFIDDLGFQSRAEQFEREATYYDDLLKAHPIAQQVGDGIPDLALDLIKTGLDTLTPEKAGRVAEQLRRIPKVGPELEASMRQLGQTAPGAARLAAWGRVMGVLDPVLTAFKLGTADDTREALIEAFSTTIKLLVADSAIAAGSPWLMTGLAAEIGVVTPLVVDVVQGWIHWPSVKRLLELNDSQLAALNARTKELKTHIDRRKQIRAELAARPGDCDSTKMVRKPGNGTSAGTRALVGVAAAGAGVALGLALMPALDTMGATCGAAPSIPSSCLGMNRDPVSCNAALERYREWCSCNGRTFDTGTGSCR